MRIFYYYKTCVCPFTVNAILGLLLFTLFEFALSLSYILWPVPSHKVRYWRCPPDPLSPTMVFNPFQRSNSSKVWCRPLFNTFQAPSASISMFKVLLLAGPAIQYDFFCDGSEAFSLLCRPGWFLTTPCSFRLGCLRPIFTEAFIEEFTSFLL